MTGNIPLYELIVKLAAILGASFIIERILSFLNEAVNRLFLFQYSNRFTQAEKLQEQLNQLDQASLEDKTIRAQVATDKDPNEFSFNPSVPKEKQINSQFDLLLIKPIKQILDDNERYLRYKEVNAILKDFWMQVLGTLIAIIICRSLNFSIWEFFVYFKENAFPVHHSMFEFVFTGIIIGSGSKPINFLMNFLINRKIEANINEVQGESGTVSDSEISAKPETKGKIIPVATKIIAPETIEEIVGFEYDGGDRPSRLENSHLYNLSEQPIDLIVYHHTTMHCDAPFEELVKEFNRKGWLTGYNCVVFKDGTIRVLCRWDRFGNHALSHNSHSFGIAFQGNFEPNPNVPCSNPNGEFGILAPTSKQIQAAARVVAMYALLHKVPFVFPDAIEPSGIIQGIIPHNLIAKKACPGSNFPHDDFRESTRLYYNKWISDANFLNALDIFKKKPMVMVKN